MSDTGSAAGPSGSPVDGQAGKPTAGPADEAALVAYARALADAVPPALHRWVRRSVDRVAADAGVAVTAPMRSATDDAARRCGDDVGAQVRALLSVDIDAQRGAPLDLLRSAVDYPTAVLSSFGVAPVERDEFDQRVFPDDVYGLTPASFADIDESLHEPGLHWGAAKAHVHLARRRAAGQMD